MSNARTFVDMEGALRDYLKTVPALSALVGSRVFLGIPSGGTSLPFIQLSRVGGGPDVLTPLDNAEISFSCWGAKKEEAANVSAALVSVLESMTAGTELESGLKCGGASVLLWLWSPDTSTDKPGARYLVDARITVKAVPAA